MNSWRFSPAYRNWPDKKWLHASLGSLFVLKLCPIEAKLKSCGLGINVYPVNNLVSTPS